MTMKKKGSNGLKPHFVLVPFLAQGHILPMLDVARMLAHRGALVTFITTPANAARITATIDAVHSSGLPIDFVELPFPTAEAGLPDGCENIDMILITSKDLYINFFEANRRLRQPLDRCLRDRPRTDCIISDMCNPWTAPVARELGVPRLVFHGPSCFYILCSHNLHVHKVYERAADAFEPLPVPGMPHPVEISKAHAPGWFNALGTEKLRQEALEAESTADGVVMNTFDELEHSYIESYKNATGKQVWAVGPLCVYNKDFSSKAHRGNRAAISVDAILSWLESKATSSVIYVNFGSVVRLRPSQFIEMGAGLEASGQPFIWAVKEPETSPEVERWLAEGFEERASASGRGLVIKGWAPQMVILSHPSVGGFLTHCGWNSTLEAVSAGVPMLTWPCFADQFCNERLVVEHLRIGISMGVKMPGYYLSDDSEVQVKRDDVENAVRRLMDEGEDGTERRARAQKLSDKARKAMEPGGSSHQDLTSLIKFSLDCESKQQG